MLPPDWDELSPLIDAALDAPPEQRPALLLELSGGDPRRHADLVRLLAESERSDPLLSRPAAVGFASLLDDGAAMPQVLGARYHIEREIGRGGMARVFLARDAKHGRRVAVKVIRPELAASLGRERFLREIDVVARLRHPNIVPLFDSGDADGLLYFVMPYEDGPSLRACLGGGRALSVAERVSVLRDVARALAYAHEQGVVHRDVKPDNVMLSGGAAVVTDFGISKAVSVAQGPTVASTLTQVGAGIGTPAYMAPEQALGDPSTDHRADLYSFGCLAYELFTGRPPFNDLSAHQLIAAHVGTTPTPVREAGADVPAGVAALIDRCLEKNPDARPQSAHELLASLEGTLPTVVPQADRRRLSNAAILALVSATVMIVGTGAYLASRTHDAPPLARTVAVLPLLGPPGDSLQQELADGLSDEIAASLSKVAGLRVVSRRGAGNYRGQRDVDLIDIGKRLGAAYLLTGSMHESNDSLKVLAQLLDASDRTLIWAEPYHRAHGELDAIRDAIARAVGDTLRRIMGVSGSGVSSTAQLAHPVNPEAYRLYVLAQRALTRRGLSLRSSIDMFSRATELDTLYAQAYAGLSVAVALSPYFQQTPVEQASQEATRAAQRALHLDPTLAQPHIALGLIQAYAYEWERAGEEFQKAVALDGHDVEARVQYGRHLLFRDRPTEALRQLLAARNEDPASALVSSWVAYSYYVLRQPDSANVESARAYQSDSTNMTTLVLGALIRLKAGRFQEARRFAEKVPFQAGPTMLYVTAALGDTANAFALFRKFESTPPRPTLLESRRAYLMLGAHDTARALSALERATDRGESWPLQISIRDPLYDSIRESPRFQRLLERVRLR